MAKAGIPFAKIVSLINGKEPLVTKESIEALALNKKVSHKKAQQELGFTPRELTTTIRDTYAWFFKERFLKSNPKAEELLEVFNS
jgi:dihydroflavonol-4-reductase